MQVTESLQLTSDVGTVADAFLRAVDHHPDEPALADAEGSFALTWREYGARVSALASGLRTLGVGRGDRVALLMGNRPEFNLIDSAALFLGAIPFSIYSTSASEQIAYISGHATPKVYVVEPGARERLEAAGISEPVFYLETNRSGRSALDQIEGVGSAPVDLRALAAQIRPDDVLTLIYTSGTTGPPKGVELTHAALMFTIRAMLEGVPLPERGRLLSYLPHAHVVDRFATHYLGMATGSLTTTLRDGRTVFSHTPAIRPTMFFAVPRTWEKLRQSLTAELEAGPEADEFRTMLELGRRRVLAAQLDAGAEAEWQGLRAALGMRIRQRLGLQDARWLVTGSTRVDLDMLMFFAALGMPVCENWGMSENCGLGTLNDSINPRIGSVGRALPGTELKLADDGEILCRGGYLMRGYRDDPEATAAALDADGWLHTGDLGAIDADGFVAIVGRKKEIIINASGKNMSPANIEAAVRNSSPIIGQVCCIGDGRSFNTALIVLDPIVAEAVAAEDGDAGLGLADLVEHISVRAMVESAVADANRRLARVEQIKRFRLLPDAWPADGDLVTPTMKLRRRAVLRRYAETIEELYQADTPTGVQEPIGRMR
jgi:long-subunit acyl-CoA synthetase (AMP-forming)